MHKVSIFLAKGFVLLESENERLYRHLEHDLWACTGAQCVCPAYWSASGGGASSATRSEAAWFLVAVRLTTVLHALPCSALRLKRGVSAGANVAVNSTG